MCATAIVEVVRSHIAGIASAFNIPMQQHARSFFCKHALFCHEPTGILSPKASAAVFEARKRSCILWLTLCTDSSKRKDLS